MLRQTLEGIVVTHTNFVHHNELFFGITCINVEWNVLHTSRLCTCPCIKDIARDDGIEIGTIGGCCSVDRGAVLVKQLKDVLLLANKRIFEQ